MVRIRNFRKTSFKGRHYIQIRLTRTMAGSARKIPTAGINRSFETRMAEVNDVSQIKQYFQHATVFVTGATGFLGKLILEKLLRTCDPCKVYLLLRPKSGRSVGERLDAMLAEQLFNQMKNERPDFMEKITTLRGECYSSDLGLTESDRQLLVEEVNCVFHLAASVTFNETLRTSSYVNVRATRDMVTLAKDMKKLKSFVYVSTAYNQEPGRITEEEFYKPYLTCDELLTFVDALNEGALQKITSTLIGNCPNTYVFTKSVAEATVATKGLGLPIAIVRPSLVIATAKEPIAGWIDNLYGPTGLLVAANLGITRTTLAKSEFYADVVPADYVVNALLAISWQTANLRSLNENREMLGLDRQSDEEIAIYNVVSSTETPITWGNFMRLSMKHSSEVPSTLLISHSWNNVTSNERLHYLCVLVLHYIPGFFIDFLAFCMGRPPLLLLIYSKIEEFSKDFKYFTLNQWFFRNKNTQELWKLMNAADKQLFDFDMSSLNWDMYYYNYMRGVRVYVLKDPMETVLTGSKKHLRMKIVHHSMIFGACVMLYKFIRHYLQI